MSMNSKYEKKQACHPVKETSEQGIELAIDCMRE